jgi:hypothetical protein
MFRKLFNCIAGSLMRLFKREGGRMSDHVHEGAEIHRCRIDPKRLANELRTIATDNPYHTYWRKIVEAADALDTAAAEIARLSGLLQAAQAGLESIRFAHEWIGGLPGSRPASFEDKIAAQRALEQAEAKLRTILLAAPNASTIAQLNMLLRQAKSDLVTASDGSQFEAALATIAELRAARLASLGREPPR